jgi:hypothetical protein
VEQQQPENHDIEHKADEEQPPPSNTEYEKMYRDTNEVESFEAEALVPTSRLQALVEHLGITTAPRYRIKEAPRLEQGSSRPSQRSSSEPDSSAGTRGQLSEHLAATLWLTPLGRPSLRGSVATGVDYRTPSIATYITGRRINSRPMR